MHIFTKYRSNIAFCIIPIFVFIKSTNFYLARSKRFGDVRICPVPVIPLCYRQYQEMYNNPEILLNHKQPLRSIATEKHVYEYLEELSLGKRV